MGKKADVLEIVLDLNGFEEIHRWILSWGARVEVMEPAELRDRVLASVEETRSLYQRKK